MKGEKERPDKALLMHPLPSTIPKLSTSAGGGHSGLVGYGYSADRLKRGLRQPGLIHPDKALFHLAGGGIAELVVVAGDAVFG